MTLDSVTLLYTYISRFSVNPNYISSGKNSGKVSAINFIPNRSSLRFQLLSQMAHVCFHGRKWVHTRLSEKDRTQRHTRRKRGAFRMGPQSLPSTRTARSRTSPGRVLERGTLPLLGLGRGCAPEERRKPSGQRCAYARRCPEASRPRWAA